MLFPSGFTKSKRPRWNVHFLQLLLNFFPLHFSLTSSVPPCVGHRSAHPPISLYSPNCSTHPPTLPPSTNPLSSVYCITIHLHFFDPFRAQRQALSLPWAPWFSTLTAPSVSGAVPAACCGRRALLFLHGVCVFFTQTIEQTH